MTPPSPIKNFFDKFALDLLFPRRCLVCGSFGDWFCLVCQRTVKLNQSQSCAVCGQNAPNGMTHPSCAGELSLNGLMRAAHFQQLQQLIHAFKYQGITELSAPLAEIYMRFIESFGYKNFVSNFQILPVPLHPKKRLMRGYNQSELLAQALVQKLGAPCDTAVLMRTKDSPSQTTLDKRHRANNVRGCFACADSNRARGKNFLLLDDIATTGATLSECAKTLKRAGAREVWGLVLAQA